ncbi:hypothetical protein BST61_g537 [Cercospora zeina]
MNPYSGNLEDLISDAPSNVAEAIYTPKHARDYVPQLVRIPALATSGLHAIPGVAWKKIGTSRDLHAMITSMAHQEAGLNPIVVQSSQLLVQNVAGQEREEYLKLLTRYKESGVLQNPVVLNALSDELFSPNKHEI